MRPIYVALEGVEGCGKSTQAARLAGSIEGSVLTRENGGTIIGQQIRKITHSLSSLHPMHPWCEALLFAADRAQHIAEVVDPALYAGRAVISDRSYISTLAYQGFGRELDIDQLLQVNSIAVHDRWPDLVIHLEIDYEMMMHRKGQDQLDRIESEKREFFERVIKGFEEMRIWAPCDRWVVIDGTQSESTVTNAIAVEVERYIAERVI